MIISRPVKQAALALLIAIMIHGIAAQGSAEPERIAPANLRILGITLGRSTTEDLEQVLGAATDTLSPQNDLSQFCYISSSADETVLEFIIWDRPVGFRFFRAHPDSNSKCIRTALVTDGLETEGGLKLGMERSKIISILGQPTHIQGREYIYDFSYDRPLTPEEVKRYKGATPPVAVVGVTEKIEFEFEGSKVSLVGVTYSETF
jgi:hypothetical protein